MTENDSAQVRQMKRARKNDVIASQMFLFSREITIGALFRIFHIMLL